MTRKRPPILAELLEDPVIRAMMDSDHVTPDDVRRLFENLTRAKSPALDTRKEVHAPKNQTRRRPKCS